MTSFVCYAVVNSIGLFGLASLQLSQSQYIDELTNYFICESSGSNQCKRSFEKFFSPVSTTVAIFLVGTLFQLVILLYVIDVKEVCGGVTYILSTGMHKVYKVYKVYSSSAGESSENNQ